MRFEVRYIEWIDSAGRGSWHDLAVAVKAKLDPIGSVGFVVAETDEHVTIIQSFTNRDEVVDDLADNSISIPKVAIRDSRTIIKADDL